MTIPIHRAPIQAKHTAGIDELGKSGERDQTIASATLTTSKAEDDS